MSEAVLGEDGVARCPWGSGLPVLRAYHDEEWGRPVDGESALFERLSLEGWASRAAYFNAYNQIDIRLDPFPFTGGTTSALACAATATCASANRPTLSACPGFDARMRASAALVAASTAGATPLGGRSSSTVRLGSTSDRLFM